MSINANKSSSQSGGSFHQVSSLAAASSTSCDNKNEKKRKHATAAVGIARQTACNQPLPSSSERVRAVTPNDELFTDENKNKKTKKTKKKKEKEKKVCWRFLLLQVRRRHLLIPYDEQSA